MSTDPFFFLDDTPSFFNFRCDGCGRMLPYIPGSNRLELCNCEKSMAARAAEAERLRQFAKQQDATKPTFYEICQSRKLRTRKRING